MTSEQKQPKPTPAELRARLVGNSLAHDREIIAFWQTADDHTRGHALYEVLALTDRIIAATGSVHQEPNRMILEKGRITIQPRE